MYIRPKTSAQRIKGFGFSLVELMIALVLGLLIIGGIITIFVSSQQSYGTKTAFDNAQEAFRFASHTIARVARSADSVDPTSTGVVLALRLTGVEGGLVTDCLGTIVPVDTVVINRFQENAGNLECVTDTATRTLVSDVQSVSFTYGVPLPGDATSYLVNDRYALNSPADARAVRTTITMASALTDLSVTFTSAIRAAITPDIIVIRPDA